MTKKEYAHDYYLRHKQQRNENSNRWQKKNRVIVNERANVYYSKHAQERINYAVKYIRTRRHTDFAFRLRSNLSRRLRHALKNNSKKSSVLKYLGCSIDNFKKYIENKFEYGMSWKNYGEWQLDHIVPLSKFDLTDEQQLMIALHYSNHQPLWNKENIVKGNLSVEDFRGGIF